MVTLLGPMSPFPPTTTPKIAEVGGRRRRWLAVVVSVLAAVLIGLGAVLVVRPGPVDRWLAGDPAASRTASATPEPTPTPVLAAADNAGPPPSAAALRAAIEPLVTSRALGAVVNVSIVDVGTGEALYQRNPDTLTTPASTTKLLTAAAVLAARGPAYRLTTRAVAGPEPGDVVLVGGGDPTLAVNSVGQFPGAARLDKLAAQVKTALGATKPRRVLIDTSLFTGSSTGPGWKPADISPGGQVAAIQSLMTNAGRITPVHHEVGPDPRFRDPASAAGTAFARQLGVRTAVIRTAAPAAAPAGPSAAPGSVATGATLGAGRVAAAGPTDRLDAATERQRARGGAGPAGGARRRRTASFQGATAAITAKLTELGLTASEARLYDASGLSRRNAISPSLLTDVLGLAASGTQPAVAAMFGGLPVAGWSGTLRTRFVTPDPNQVGQGVVRAKTGSLSGVNAMAGELVTRDGRLLVFAIMAKGAPSTLAARTALDRVAAKLVACGCG
jgi:D-alanyl-D-alanine carboxypeptidase/D-alanyl-D-alanine-endopeptidase (penicillin-binding protein 4)